MSERRGWRSLVDDLRRFAWIIGTFVAVASIVIATLRTVSGIDPGVQVVLAVVAAAFASAGIFFATWVTHFYFGWPSIHPVGSRQHRQVSELRPDPTLSPMPHERQAGSPNGVVTDAVTAELVDIPRLPENELSFSAEQNANNVSLVVRNPEAEPKEGFSLWLEDLQKHSPSVGFHPVEQFAKAPKPCGLKLGRSQLYHGQKAERDLISWLAGKPRIRCDLRGGYHEIALSAGVWRVRLKLKWNARSRLTEVFIECREKSVLLATDPTQGVP